MDEAEGGAETCSGSVFLFPLGRERNCDFSFLFPLFLQQL